MKAKHLATLASLLPASILPFLAGCANPAPPHPPSLQLPLPVNDLAAQRSGDDVHLHWSTPSQATDHVPLKAGLTAELCRTPGTCTTFPVQPGPSETTDNLLSPYNLDPPVKLTYSLTLRNAAGRAATPSNPATSVGGAAPAPIANLQAASTRNGTRLTWTAASGPAAAVELERQETLPASTKANKANVSKELHLRATEAPQASPHSKAGPQTPAIKTARLTVPQQATDPGGALDQTTVPGGTYRYAATRVRTVAIGPATYTLRGAASAPVTLLARDINPPATPTHLAVIVDGSAADLSWEPNTEPDLAGYIVYRSQQSPQSPGSQPTGPQVSGAQAPETLGPASGSPPPSSWLRLNESPLPAPAFQDNTLPANRAVLYRIVAIDLAGNQSAPSQPVAAEPHFLPNSP